MSHYQNGQHHYSSHNHPAQGHQQPQNMYGHQPPYSDSSHQRLASFDTGDDTTALSPSEDQARAAGGYTAYGSSPAQYDPRPQPMTIETSLPYRSNTQTVPLSGYQHHHQSGTPSHASYNPAQYQQQQSQYNPQSYTTPQTAYPSSSYQPYIPAAYQDSLQRQSSVYNNSSYYSPTPQTAFLSSQAPPPPPRPTEYLANSSSYVSRQSDYTTQPSSSYDPRQSDHVTHHSSYDPRQSDHVTHQSSSYDPRQSDYVTHHSSSYGGHHYETSYGSGQYQTTSSVPSRQPAYSPGAPAPPAHDYSAQARPYSHSPASRQNSSPDITRNTSLASRISDQSSSFASSPQPSVPTPPSRQPSNRSPERIATQDRLSQGPQRSNTLDRHPQGRSLPGVPSESESESDYFHPHVGQTSSSSAAAFDDIMQHLDSAIGRSSSNAEPTRHQSRGGSPGAFYSPDEAPTHLNGNIAATGDAYVNYGAFTDDSDAEAAAGLAAMQALDEQERAEDARRRSGSATLFPTQPHQNEADHRAASSQDASSDSDYAGFDLSAAGGGFVPDMRYGNEISVSNYAAAAASVASTEQYSRLDPTRMNSVRSSGVSSEGRESYTSGYESIPPNDAIHPFPAIRDVARVDTGGTGGLTEPSPHPRRLSYEDGDEGHFEWDIGHTPEGQSPTKEAIPDLFFHPGMNNQRPLPPPPSNSDPGRIPHLRPAGTYTQQSRFSQYTSDNRASYYPGTPDAYNTDLLSPSPVPRSTSLSSQSNRPRVDQPIRSKTDADRAKILRQQQAAGRPMSDIYDPSEPSSAIALDLPALPRKKFNPAKLTNEQFKKCSEPWALSSILTWIKDLADEEADLRQSTVVEGIVALFTNKVPTMNTTEAESLGERVVEEMLAENALVKEEEWVKFGPGMMSGVLFQLSGLGCYSSKLHVYETRGRCYSYHCMRTLKVVDTSMLSGEKKSEDWATHYKLKKEDMKGHDRKEIELQNNLHEVVTSEEGYVNQLSIIQVLYRDALEAAQPPIIPSKKLDAFLKDAFGLVDQVKKVNQDYLLGRLKYRQNEQGPWIAGFSDIFREWIRRARMLYVKYAENYPRADFLVRREAERNLHFRNFLETAQQDRRSNRLDWQTYLKSPITKMQRYSLLLGTIYKNMVKESEEKTNLAYAIDEIKAATHEADSKFAEVEKKMLLHEYQAKLKLRPQMEKEVELNLDHLGREIIIKGDLLRSGGKGFQWVETHAVLFDHYLVLAKQMKTGVRQDYYDVSKVPIPMDLIILESRNDGAVLKSGMKIGAVTTTVVPRGQSTSNPHLNRTTSTTSGDSGSLQHVNTSMSIGSGVTGQSMVPVTTIETNSKDEKIMYPFRIKHLGKKEIYTLYAFSAQNRDEWCEAIISAKERHADQLQSQNSEPFKLRVLADTAFGYDTLAHPARRISIRGTPLDQAIKESEKKYEGQGRPAPVCRAKVECATVFNQPYGRLMCAVGTANGVYISEYGNTRGWIKSIQMPNITQIAVLEEFNLFLLISDKVLIAYHLDAICSPTGSVVSTSDSSSRRAPQKLSGSKDVGFFATGRMRDRALVFYKKRDGITSTFKILEPVLQRSTTSRSRFMPSASRRGQTEFFREYDEFYIPTECFGMNLFSTTVAISTARGVEVLGLEKKMTFSVPTLKSSTPDTQAHLSSIASRITDLKPLGMFRLGEAEFLVTFEECAVYVNKHGDVSRGVVMEFVGKASKACLHGQYLILFDEDFVEIRDAQNGRLKQVIAGKGIAMLDDGGGGTGGAQTNNGPQASLGGGANGLGMQGFNAAPRTVKLCMQHPEYEKSQVIVELLLKLDEEEGR